MNRKEIRCEIDKLAALVEGWNASEAIPALERDLALEQLRRLYEAIRFAAPEVEPASECAEKHPVEEPAADASVVAPAAPAGVEPAAPLPAAEEAETVVAGELPDLDELLAFGSEPEVTAGFSTPESDEPAAAPEEPVAEPEPAPEPEAVAELAPEPVPEPAPEPVEAVEPPFEPVPEPVPVSEPTVESVADPVPVIVPAEPAGAPIPVIAPQPELEPAPVAEPEPVAVPQPEPAAAPEPVAVPEPEPVAAPEPKASQTDQTLFGLEDDTVRHRRKQRVIMSLYDTPSDPEPPLRKEPSAASPAEGRTAEAIFLGRPVAEPAAAPAFPEPAVPSDGADVPPHFEPRGMETPVASGAVLGDVINHDVQTLADTIAPHRDVASELRRQEPVDDLRKAIGINDKFLMIRDLFGGDRLAYDQAIDTLNACEGLDDCMIYIAENYAWNPDSDGARLLMELLERKFS